MGCCLDLCINKNKQKQESEQPFSGDDQYQSPQLPHIESYKNEVIPISNFSKEQCINESQRKQSLTDTQREEESIKKKELGNQSFKKNDFLSAISFYTEAINLFKESIYYSNRAQSYRQLSNWTEVLKDSCEAIRLDQQNYKAYNLKGMAQVMLSRDMDVNQDEWEPLNNQGIKCMQKGRCLSQLQNDDYFNNFKNVILNSFRSYQHGSNISKSIQILNLKKEERKKMKINKAQELLQKLQKQSKSPILNEQIMKFAERKFALQKHEPSDAFMCIFTLVDQFIEEFMVNPVIASSGMSYEKSLLDDHVKANGEVDPVTRANIDPTKYIENKNLKLAIQDYQRKIIDSEQADNYNKINF